MTFFQDFFRIILKFALFFPLQKHGGENVYRHEVDFLGKFYLSVVITEVGEFSVGSYCRFWVVMGNQERFSTV